MGYIIWIIGKVLDIIFYYSSYKYLDVSFLIRLVFGIVRKIWQRVIQEIL